MFVRAQVTNSTKNIFISLWVHVKTFRTLMLFINISYTIHTKLYKYIRIRVLDVEIFPSSFLEQGSHRQNEKKNAYCMLYV